MQASPNATIDQTSRFTDKVNDVFKSFPETAETFQITNPSGGFSGMVTKPWSERHRATQQIVGEVFGKVSTIPGVRVIATAPEPLPGGSQFPIEFVINSTASPREIYDYANQIVQKAMESKIFMFADTDLKFDQPQTEIVFDRDKVAALGLNLSQVGADLGTMLGGNYVNRFSILGRSYKVIPEVKRERAAERGPAAGLLRERPGRKTGSALHLRSFEYDHAAAHAEPLPAIELRQNPGSIPALCFTGHGAEGAGRRRQAVLPKGFTVDYGGSSRQLRVEGSKLIGTFVLSIILIFLVLAAQFESFRDPFIILLGSVPLALVGALMPAFLGLTTFNIYSQVGLITLVGLVSKNGILIVEFANKMQEEGLDKMRAVVEAAGTRLRPILMTSVATVVGHFPLVLASGPGAGLAEQHRLRAGHRHDCRDGLYPFRGAGDLCGRGARSPRAHAEPDELDLPEEPLLEPVQV